MPGLAADGHIRQALLVGRAAEAVTGRPLPIADAVLEVLLGGVARRIDAHFGQSAGGWFAVTPRRVADLPTPQSLDELDPATPPPLAAWRVRTVLRDGREVSGSVAVPPGGLDRIRREITVGGVPVSGEVLAQAPFSLHLSAEPLPVRIAGVVIADHDLSQPVPDARVAVGPASTLTDPRGWFALEVTPTALEIEISVTRNPGVPGAATTTFLRRLDFLTSVNSIDLSIPV
ncbi:MAG TPA: hypothetical protein PKE40_03080 [Arachnia sp.]|mgnify:CR=1 FL=1|nr:hypothetical protein [Arachnia sp.]HMT85313.1 hypothetical protein [Arachnia sp.]